MLHPPAPPPAMPRAWLAPILVLGLGGCGSEAAELECSASGSTMGTRWTVRVVAPADWDEDRLGRLVQSELDAVDGAMSTWKPESELSRFNAARPGPDEWFEVSTMTAIVVARSLHWAHQSGGAFDVTVAPLVELWGFGAGTAGPPDADALQQARARVGSERLQARQEPPALRKTHPELSVDLSAIAKGYAVDRVVHALEEAGCSAAMVEVGGEVRCSGTKRDGAPWSIGIEAAVRGERRLDRALQLDDAALASSGDYRNFRELDGEELSHILDPRTGEPCRHSLAGVSVVASSCADADAICTALMVMGPEEGYAWAVQRDLAARFVTREGNILRVRCTPAFAQDHGDR